MHQAGRQVGDRRHIIFATLLVSSKVTVGTKGVSGTHLAFLCLSAFQTCRDCVKPFRAYRQSVQRSRENVSRVVQKGSLLCFRLLMLLSFANSSKKNKLGFHLTSLMWIAAMTNHLDFPPLHPAPAYKPVSSWSSLIIQKSIAAFTYDCFQLKKK